MKYLANQSAELHDIVTIVLPNLAAGGAQRQGALLARELLTNGQSVEIFLTHSREVTRTNSEILLGIPVIFARDWTADLRPVSLAAFASHASLNVGLVGRFRTQIKSITSAILHYVAGSDKTIAALLRGNIKIAIATRSLKFHLRRRTPRALFSFLPQTNIISLLSSGTPSKVIVVERNDYEMQAIGTRISQARQLLYPKAALIAANSRNSTLQLVRAFPKNEVRFLPNFLSPLKVKEPFPKAEKNIAVVGRLEAQKRPLEVLSAFSQSAINDSEWTISFSGSGTLEKDLEVAISSSPNPEKIQFKGYVDSQDQTFSRSAICVINSDYEGSPNVLAESIAYGVIPLVRANVIEANEFIPDDLREILIFHDGNELRLFFDRINELSSRRDEIVRQLQRHYTAVSKKYTAIRQKLLAEVLETDR